ncbi:MAG: hypothetical protein IJ093_03825 [Bacilli bacterium]|nr:hypothetical protein [Bacilli bacterium]
MAIAKGVYSLTVNGKAVPVPWGLFNDIDPELKEKSFKFKDKVKVPLTIIDAFTTNFYTEEGLILYLSKQFSDNIKTVEITYRENKQTRTIPIILKDQQETHDLSRDQFGNSDFDDKAFNSALKKVFNIKRTNSYIYDFLCKYGYICEKLNEYLNTCYHYSGDEEGYRFHLDKLKKRFNYRSYRNICIGIKALYDKTKESIPEEPKLDHEAGIEADLLNTASIEDIENYFGISLTTDENQWEGYTIDPEKQMKDLDNPDYDDDDFRNPEFIEPNIYDNITIEQNGQSVLPFEKVGYVKKLKGDN